MCYASVAGTSGEKRAPISQALNSPGFSGIPEYVSLHFLLVGLSPMKDVQMGDQGNVECVTKLAL